MKTYHYGRQVIDADDIAAVAEALSTDFLSQGPRLEEFETRVAEYCKARHCLAVCNGTAALHLACLSLGVGSGDIGWTSPMSFVASSNCLRYCGAEPDFVDIGPQSLNFSTRRFADKLEKSKADGKMPKVIIPVHFAGTSCEMKEIRELADQYGIRIIEDACHALGGMHEGQPIGSCQFSDITAFSLHPVKSMTTGEGGLILTNDTLLYEKMRSLRSHGLAKAGELGHPDPWRVEMVGDGFNYRITDFQCALGMSQLDKLDGFISTRQRLAAKYQERLLDVGWMDFQQVDRPEESARHLMVGLFDFAAMGVSKREYHARLREQGVNLMVHYLPIHLNPIYRDLGFGEGMFPAAEEYYERAFSLPLHPGLTEADVDHVCDLLVGGV